MLKLCTRHIDKNTEIVRERPQELDRLTNFLFNKEDPTSHILSFFGMKGGEQDLCNASKQRLLELGLQKKVPRDELNASWINEHCWGVRGDSNGEVVDGESDDEGVDWDSDY